MGQLNASNARIGQRNATGIRRMGQRNAAALVRIDQFNANNASISQSNATEMAALTEALAGQNAVLAQARTEVSDLEEKVATGRSQLGRLTALSVAQRKLKGMPITENSARLAKAQEICNELQDINAVGHRSRLVSVGQLSVNYGRHYF